MKPLRRLLMLVLLLALAPLARAGISSAPGRDLQVELVTYGPGRVYWERFGHIAIILRDTSSGEAISFNYGVFDFDTHDFFLKFIRGHMLYSMDAEYAGPEVTSYIDAGRAVRIEKLAFTPAQAAALRDFLLWNDQPQNRSYRYDYFYDNCATRVRDALNRALGGAIYAQTQLPATGRSFRSQSERMLAHDLPLMLLVDLGLGPRADRPLTLWQDSFLPVTLSDLLQHVRVPDGRGGTQPLVASSRLIYAGDVSAPPPAPPALRWPLLGIGVSWAALLLWGARQHAGAFARGLGAAAAGLYALLGGVAGLIMLALWMLTTHRSAWANQNLLQFDPALLLLSVPLLRGIAARHAPRRWTRALALLLAALSVFGLLGRLTPWLPQANLHWILFALPLNLALAWTLWRPRAAR
jgi:hypothetical protein